MRWTIEEIESCGFKLIINEKLCCHFRGHGFDVFINLEERVTGDLFIFKSYKQNLKGNFKAKLSNVAEMELLLKVIQ